MFEHLLPGEKVPNLATSAFSFTQGSSKVTTRIENDVDTYGCAPAQETQVTFLEEQSGRQ